PGSERSFSKNNNATSWSPNEWAANLFESSDGLLAASIGGTGQYAVACGHCDRERINRRHWSFLSHAKSKSLVQEYHRGLHILFYRHAFNCTVVSDVLRPPALGGSYVTAYGGRYRIRPERISL